MLRRMMRAPVTLAILLVSPIAFADTVTVTTTVTVDTAPALMPPALTPTADKPPSTEPRDRNVRVTVGAGPSLGFDTKDKCGEGECVGLHAQVGGSIARHWMMLVGSSLMAEPEHHRDVHHVETISLQYWPLARLWVEAGLGVGSKRSWDYNEPPMMDLSGVAPGGTVATGYEALVREGYSLGLEARVSSTMDIHHTSFGQLLVGVSWY